MQAAVDSPSSPSGSPQTPPGDRRIDGWKAIAAYLGRDRTTVYRWARERGLPIRSIPGGKTRTVYALTSELDAWRRGPGPAEDGEQPAEPDETAGPEAGRGRAPLALFASLGIALLALMAILLLRTREAPSPPRAPLPGTTIALPRDPAIADQFVRARDAWAQRSRESLAQAIDGFEQVVRRDPGFAPAYADLADAYLLAREVGSLPDDQAFARAAAVADHARRLDRDLPAASRALGFIAYWRDGDRATTGQLFRDALSHAPDDPQTHFWYANILADNGEVAAAQREFEKARLLDPGSVDIATDWAWARWSADDADATAMLKDIVARNPENAEARDCLSMVDLAAGDEQGYLQELAARAKLRGETGLAARVATLKEAWQSGGRKAVLAIALDHEMAIQAGLARPEHALAAFYASLAGDRNSLLSILSLADRGKEQWGSAGYVRRLAARWANDPAVAPLLARRRAATIDMIRDS
jgi:tetratricopeptide (TPR) repeat protein